MLGNLMQLPRACSALPFVRLFYGQPSVYLWSDMHGNTHEIHQGEGGEQGDPLMPALFSLGQHPALVEVKQHMISGEYMFVFFFG